MSLRVIIAEREEEKRLSYRLRFDMMCRDLGWISTQNYVVPEERDEYDDKQSVVFLALDVSGNVAGTARLILPGAIPLPIERHFELYPKELIHGKMEYCVEVSRFIVPKNHMFKKHEITIMLYKSIIKECITMGVTHMLASVDYRFFRLQKILGFRFEEIGEPKFYMGSKTIPGVLPLWNLSSIRKHEKPHLYEYLMTSDKPVEEMTLI